MYLKKKVLLLVLKIFFLKVLKKLLFFFYIALFIWAFRISHLTFFSVHVTELSSDII